MLENSSHMNGEAVPCRLADPLVTDHGGVADVCPEGCTVYRCAKHPVESRVMVCPVHQRPLAMGHTARGLS